jgi:general L-amino acid transport system permease protein
MNEKDRHRLVNLLAALPVTAFLLYFIVFLIRKEFQYDFLTLPFAADIGGGFLKLKSSDFVWVAALKGVGNTLMLVVFAIVLATVLGLLFGIWRLSANPLLRGLARLYVEVLRNIPLLVLMFLFAFVVFAGLPGLRDGAGIPGLALLSNRGVALPEIHSSSGWWIWVLFVVLAAAPGVLLGRRLRAVEDATGRRTYGMTAALLSWLIVAVVSYFVAGQPLRLLPPLVEESGLFPSYGQGFVLGLGYISGLLSLSLYFGAFIAEIVRGSIQAIPRQQREAAESLGLTAGQRLRLVILPQALRIMVPSLNNEFQNANKDSSLAHLITYSEVVFVALQIANNRGNLVELFLGVFVIYVLINLTLSFLMNALNRMVQVVT